MFVQSTVIRYGDHVDTDVIIPARYLNTTDPAELAAHCMEDLDSDFKRKSETSRIIVAGRNFGCGSSREHAPIAIKASGIQLVIADSFARIFYRNSIDIGLPIIECPAAAKAIRDGDEVAVQLDTGVIGRVEVAGGDNHVRIDVIAVFDDGRLNEHLRAPPQAWRRGP